MSTLLSSVVIGVGATLLMDLWAMIRKTLLGIPPPNYGMVGRWIGHMIHGQFHHDSIAASSPVWGEQIIGWVAHYLTGIVFAALLIGIGGRSWMQSPTIGLALAVGIGTVAAPFLLMQPGMGAGIAASRTQHPTSAQLQSLITHIVFGLGLYATARATPLFWPI